MNNGSEKRNKKHCGYLLLNEYFVTWKYLRLRCTTSTGCPFLFGKSSSNVRCAHVLCVATGGLGGSYGMSDAAEVSVRLYVVPHEPNPTCSRACACKETASRCGLLLLLLLLTIRYQYHFIIVAYSLCVHYVVLFRVAQKPLDSMKYKIIFALLGIILAVDSIVKYKTFSICRVVFLFSAQQPPVGQGLLIHEVSRSHTTTLHTR